MRTQFTHGEWRFDCVDAEQGRYHITAEGDDSLFAIVLGSPSHAEANSRLMAGAPALFAALYEALMDAPYNLNKPWHFAARDALKKAAEITYD